MLRGTGQSSIKFCCFLQTCKVLVSCSYFSKGSLPCVSDIQLLYQRKVQRRLHFSMYCLKYNLKGILTGHLKSCWLDRLIIYTKSLILYCLAPYTLIYSCAK